MTLGEAGDRRRLAPRERALLIIGGIIGALALAYFLFLGGGDGGPTALPTSAPRPDRAPTARPSPRMTVTLAPTAAPETFEVFEGKDPFRPLVTEAAPSPGATPGPAGGPAGAQRVTLIDITGSGSERTATVQVNGVEYQVREGDTFAASYRVKSLTSECGTFVFGDETFTLCVGQEVLK